uniref:Macroglobulin domain-containing protein n=1 Tax=Erpetoichthys calabaricus TaxID=27687 RepID=A0A8C4SY04_ERPCA
MFEKNPTKLPILYPIIQLLLENRPPSKIYMVTIPHHIHGGTVEKVCAHLLQPNETITFTINLLMERRNLILLEETIKEKDFYKCFEFQVSLFKQSQWLGQQDENKKKVLITPIQSMTFIQTDKPIYKPGQTVKFRIFAMNKDFLPVNEKVRSKHTDPRSNRIGQWLNISTNTGIVDLSYPTTSEAPLGMYTLRALQEQGFSLHEKFKVKEYGEIYSIYTYTYIDLYTHECKMSEMFVMSVCCLLCTCLLCLHIEPGEMQFRSFHENIFNHLCIKLDASTVGGLAY